MSHLFARLLLVVSCRGFVLRDDPPRMDDTYRGSKRRGRAKDPQEQDTDLGSNRESRARSASVSAVWASKGDRELTLIQKSAAQPVLVSALIGQDQLSPPLTSLEEPEHYISHAGGCHRWPVRRLTLLQEERRWRGSRAEHQRWLRFISGRSRAT